jgi:hypothetical protein
MNNTQKYLNWILENIEFKYYIRELLELEHDSINDYYLLSFISSKMMDIENLSENQEEQDKYFKNIQQLYENIKDIVDNEMDNSFSKSIKKMLKLQYEKEINFINRVDDLMR